MGNRSRPGRIRESTEQLLEQALSAELMSGADWDDLTSNLAVLPAVFLYPRRGSAPLVAS